MKVFIAASAALMVFASSAQAKPVHCYLRVAQTRTVIRQYIDRDVEQGYSRGALLSDHARRISARSVEIWISETGMEIPGDPGSWTLHWPTRVTIRHERAYVAMPWWVTEPFSVPVNCGV